MQPARPFLGAPQDLIDAARAAVSQPTSSQQQAPPTQGHTFTLGSGGPSTFTLNGNGGLNTYPEISLFSQFPQLFPQYQNAEQHAHAPHGNLGAQVLKQHPALEELAKANPRGGSGGGGRTLSDDSRSSSAYASRHQAAEQRRRTRINERLDMLRKMVPHTERANTASFLEEVIKYVEALKSRVSALEGALQTAAKGGLTFGGGPRGVERLSTAADADLQQQQQGSNTALGAGVHLSLGGGQQAYNGSSGNTNGASDELLPGLLAPGLPNLRPQPQQHALFHAPTNKSYLSFNEELFPAVKEPPVPRRTEHAPRTPTLSLSLLAPVPPVGGNGQQQQGLQQQGQQNGGSANAALQAQQQQQLATQVLQLGQQLGQQAPGTATAVAALKALSSSPVSSEESGVPLKKRKVLVL